MGKQVRLATNDYVEIIDKSSPHYSKTGIIVDIKHVPVTMINPAGKPLSSHAEICITVTIEGIDEKFKKDQIKKID